MLLPLGDFQDQRGAPAGFEKNLLVRLRVDHQGEHVLFLERWERASHWELWKMDCLRVPPLSQVTLRGH